MSRFSPDDQRRLAQFLRIRAENDRVLRLYSQYLNHSPRFLTADMVDSLARDCDIPLEDAFRSLFSAALGLETDCNADDRRLERLYIQDGVRLLDPTHYLQDPYVKTIRFPSCSIGSWEFTTGEYAPYEPFACGHPKLLSDGREIPRLGFFSVPFSFPAVLENGVEWMTVKPNEIETMRQPIALAHGRVLAFGLGLGYFPFCVSQKPSVTAVTVVERDPALIELFRRELLPQFPHREKIRVVCSDAFAYMESTMQTDAFDFAFADLWHDASDGTEFYLRFKRMESLFPSIEFTYWIEPSIRSFLRAVLFDRLLPDSFPSFDAYLHALEGL